MMNPFAASLLASAMAAACALGGVCETDFTATGGVAPDGWTFDIAGCYSSGALKLDATGQGVASPAFGGAITSLVVAAYGYSTGGSGSALLVYASADAEAFPAEPAASLAVPSAATNAVFNFAATNGFIRCRLEYRKAKGNLALYSARAAYDEAALGARPPIIQKPAAQIARVGETLRVPLGIVATGGDEIIAATATGSAIGAFGIADGVFRFTPSAEDRGAQVFTLTAEDKDGLSAPVTLDVSVRQPIRAAIAMTASEGTYAPDFSALAAGGLWDNGAEPLAAWFAFAGTNAVESFRAGATPSAAGIWALPGPALGTLAAKNAEIRCGFSLSNATDSAISEFRVSFAAETASDAASLQMLSLLCRVSSGARPLLEGGWRRAPGLRLLSSGSPAELRGAIRATVRPGEVLALCFCDRDDAGADAAFAISALSVDWKKGEPSDEDSIALGADGAEEDFDSVPVMPGAALPPGWRVGSWGAAHTTRPFALATNLLANAFAGDAETWHDVSPGSTAFLAPSLLDTAAGGVPEYDDASVTLLAKFRNACAFPISALEIRSAVEKYMNGFAATEAELLYSASGSGWRVLAAAAFDGDLDAEPALLADAPLAVRAISGTFRMGAAIPPGGVFYLGWRITPVSSDPEISERRMALGIDDVEIRPRPASGARLILR